jgi:hypothetical protein
VIAFYNIKCTQDYYLETSTAALRSMIPCLFVVGIKKNIASTYVCCTINFCGTSLKISRQFPED